MKKIVILSYYRSFSEVKFSNATIITGKVRTIKNYVKET